MSSDLLGFAVARRTARANLLAAWLDGGALEIYDWPRPATADTAVTTQNLLVTVPLPDPAGTVSNGVWTAEDVDPALVTSTGTKIAAWVRVFDSSATVVADGDVGIAGSGALVILDNLSLVEGALIVVQSFTLTEG